jgi:hypothetical protein
MIPIHIILACLHHDHYFLRLGFIGLFFAEIPFPLLAGKAIIAQMTSIQSIVLVGCQCMREVLEIE